MTPLSVDLVLIGFGHVGRRFVSLLQEIAPRLDADCGLTWRIVGISTRAHGTALDAQGLDVTRVLATVAHGDSLGLLHDAGTGPAPRSGAASIERAAATRDPARPLVVVETTLLDIEAGQPAIEHVRTAIRCGAHVITANKGPAAFAYRELRALADAAGVAFRFEGTVMDGIPIFNLVRETMPAVRVLGFRGVVNSTTNWILTAMENGSDADAALREMQTAGVAEADASLDLDGWDAAAKASVLANVLLDADITPHRVARRGIREITTNAVHQAMSRGTRIRLIAAGRRNGGQVDVIVEPRELPANDLLAGPRGMANALILETDLLGDVAIGELSGGLTPTAYALVSDLVSVRRTAGV
jgi:homoserine dehydrogenase